MATSEYVGVCSECGAERDSSPCDSCGSNARIEWIKRDEPRLTDKQREATKRHAVNRLKLRGSDPDAEGFKL